MQEGGTEASDDSTGSKAGGQKTRTALPGRYTGLCTAWHGGGSKNAVKLTCGMWDDVAPSLPAGVKEAGSANILNTVQESKRKGKNPGNRTDS